MLNTGFQLGVNPQDVARDPCGDGLVEITEGFQVSYQLRSQDPESEYRAFAKIPIIMLTGFGDIMNDDGQSPPGVSLVFAKPIAHATLREGIAKLMSAHAENP